MCNQGPAKGGKGMLYYKVHTPDDGNIPRLQAFEEEVVTHWGGQEALERQLESESIWYAYLGTLVGAQLADEGAPQFPLSAWDDLLNCSDITWDWERAGCPRRPGHLHAAHGHGPEVFDLAETIHDAINKELWME